MTSTTVGADEGRHPTGPERLWNESWYFDLVDVDAGVGAYLRFGLYPNLGVTWFTAYVTGPDRPAIALIDLAASLPVDHRIACDGADFHAELEFIEPGKRVRVRAVGTGSAHADHAAVLQQHDGHPMPLGFDLTWSTAGRPFRYSRLSRYEVPSMVEGVVRVGEEELRVRGAGQRDHSWGPRDWWRVEWLWFAFRMDDGERLHALQVRQPDGGSVATGYVQRPGAPLAVVTAASAEEIVAPDGLVTSASLRLTPGPELNVRAVGSGPLRFVAEDGRLTEFPRAMCLVTDQDGRRGAGWAEWGFNRSLDRTQRQEESSDG